jgi:hypothetical protein
MAFIWDDLLLYIVPVQYVNLWDTGKGTEVFAPSVTTAGFS